MTNAQTEKQNVEITLENGATIMQIPDTDFLHAISFAEVEKDLFAAIREERVAFMNRADESPLILRAKTEAVRARAFEIEARVCEIVLKRAQNELPGCTTTITPICDKGLPWKKGHAVRFLFSEIRDTRNNPLSIMVHVELVREYSGTASNRSVWSLKVACPMLSGSANFRATRSYKMDSVGKSVLHSGLVTTFIAEIVQRVRTRSEEKRIEYEADKKRGEIREMLCDNNAQSVLANNFAAMNQMAGHKFFVSSDCFSVEMRFTFNNVGDFQRLAALLIANGFAEPAKP